MTPPFPALPLKTQTLRFATVALLTLGFAGAPGTIPAQTISGGAAVDQQLSETRRQAAAGDYLERLRDAFRTAEAAVRARGFAVGAVTTELADFAPYGIRGHYCGDGLIVWLNAEPPGLGATAASRISALGAHRTRAGGRVSLFGVESALPPCLAALVPANRAAVFATVQEQVIQERELRSEERTLPCPPGRTGTGMRQVRYAYFDPGTNVELAEAQPWTTIADDCRQDWTLRAEESQIEGRRTVACGGGQTGRIAQLRTGTERRILDENDTLLQTKTYWGPWRDMANSCTSSNQGSNQGGGNQQSEVRIWHDADGNITGDIEEWHETVQVNRQSAEHMEFQQKQAEERRENAANNDNDGDGNSGPDEHDHDGDGINNSGNPDGVCFGAGTRIAMADGSTKPIEWVRLGDVVMAFDGMGALEPRAVIGRREQIREVISLGGTLVTSDHPFLQPDGSFAPVGSIPANGALIEADGTAVPVPRRGPVGATVVYDITVEGLSTYVADGWRVHNW